MNFCISIQSSPEDISDIQACAGLVCAIFGGDRLFCLFLTHSKNKFGMSKESPKYKPDRFENILDLFNFLELNYLIFPVCNLRLDSVSVKTHKPTHPHTPLHHPSYSLTAFISSASKAV